MILGITGPIGSGKDEVCKVLKKRGFHIIDADKIGHQLLGKGINREKLGDEVFADKNKLKELNARLHPEIKKIIVGQVATCHYNNIAINAALLKEIGLIELCDEVWVVAARKSDRIKWIVKKKRYDRNKINDIMRNQMPQKGYLAIADWIIWNKGTLNDLRSRIKV